MEEEERSTDSLYFTIESIGALILHDVGWNYTMNYWSCSVLDENDSQFVRRIFFFYKCLYKTLYIYIYILFNFWRE